MLFVHGPNATSEENLPSIVAQYEAKGFDLTFVSASDFAAAIVALAPDISWAVITDLLNKHLESMRAKEETLAHCREALSKA